MSTTDWNDIQDSLAGDHDAFGRLVERHEAAIARLMWRFSRDRQQCEELVQDVFVEAFYSLGGYKAKAPFIHWLRRIGTRVGYRFWKQRAKTQGQLSLQDYDLPAKEEKQTTAKEAAELLDYLMQQLNPADRLVLTLQYLEGCSQKEIAGHTGWPVTVVKMRSFRARRRLEGIARRDNLLEIMQ